MAAAILFISIMSSGFRIAWMGWGLRARWGPPKFSNEESGLAFREI